MASEHPPVLFSARLAKGQTRPHRSPRVATQTMVCQLLHTLTATLEAPDPLPSLAEVLGTQLGAEACLLLRYHQTLDTFVYTCWSQGGSTISGRLSSGHTSPQVALQRRVAISLIDQPAEPNEDSISWREGLNELLCLNAQSGEWLSEIQSYASIPVQATAEIRGLVLLLSHQRQYTLALEEKTEVDIASVIAIAFHQHYLQQQAQHSTEQLRYLNYLKEDFLSTLNHELRTPLTSMMLAVRMLRRPDLTPERATLYLDILDQQCSREINLINDLLMLQTVDTKPAAVSFVPTDLTGLLHGLAEQEHSAFTAADRALALNLPPQAVIVATAKDHLTRALQELLINARKYSSPDSTVTLTLVDNLAINQSIRIQVRNTGMGIEADDLPHIFDKFRRGQAATRNAIPGTGTGLALAKGLIEQLNGTITADSQPDQGQLWQTCFTLELRPPANSAMNL